MYKKLTFPIFLEFIEIKTKITWFFPMITALLWALYSNHPINGINTLLFIIASFLVDMSTTAVNNVVDYKTALDEEYKFSHNLIGKYQLDANLLTKIIYLILSLASLLSLILLFRTDWLLFPFGAACFIIAIFYTYGPIPISRFPLGEVFSGLTEGFGIFFLTLYIQDPSLYAQSFWNPNQIAILIQPQGVITAILLSIPFVALTANIMLANNICDLEQDINNRRFTLVYYLGRDLSLKLFQVIAVVPWLMLILYPLFGYLHYITLIGLLGFPIALKSMTTFVSKPEKRTTFIESIKSYVLFALVYLLILVINISIK